MNYNVVIPGLLEIIDMDYQVAPEGKPCGSAQIIVTANRNFIMVDFNENPKAENVDLKSDIEEYLREGIEALNLVEYDYHLAQCHHRITIH